MNDTAESVYPDLLRTGLNKLGALQNHRDLLSLFAALDYFRRDLHAQENVAGILEITHRYLVGLDLFQVTGTFLVNPRDRGFDLAYCRGTDQQRDDLARTVKDQIRSGRFAAALRGSSPVFFEIAHGDETVTGILHKLAVPKEVVGMFCGLLHRGLAPTNEIGFSLLSLLLGASADAHATMRKTDQLRLEIKTLTDLLPICAWCRKVRDDRGYWEKIEDFVSTHSRTSFSHGICPDCQRKFFGVDSMPGAPSKTV